jgi:hypothetical protein
MEYTSKIPSKVSKPKKKIKPEFERAVPKGGIPFGFFQNIKNW